jgi:hypothetical protein
LTATKVGGCSILFSNSENQIDSCFGFSKCFFVMNKKTMKIIIQYNKENNTTNVVKSFFTLKTSINSIGTATKDSIAQVVARFFALD